MFVKLVRLGKDAELRTTQNGKPMLMVSAVYDVGFGDNKKGQWIGLTMFGSQAEKLASHLIKGKQIVARIDDLFVEEYQGKGYLKGTLLSFEFVSGGDKQTQPAQAQNRHNQSKSNGYQTDNFDDSDLPF